MHKGAFAAALELLPDTKVPGPEAGLTDEESADIVRLRLLAEFWSAWDRLSYKEANGPCKKLQGRGSESIGA